MTHNNGLKRIGGLLLAAVLYLTGALPSSAATLLPNGEQTFLDANGNPLALGKVYFYIPSTSTPKNTYSDSSGTLNSNPVTLDPAGRAIIYGIGCYRQVVQNSLGVQQWDKTTCDTAYGQEIWGGTAGGSPNAITVNGGNFTGGDGQVIRFIASADNSALTTVNPGSFGAITVMVDGGSGPVNTSGGEIKSGNIVTLVYDSSGGVFHLSTVTSITAGSGLSINGVGSSGGTIAVSGTLTSVEPVNAQTGTTYTVAAGDNGKLITFSNTAAIAVTVPTATGNFGAGFRFDVANVGGGLVTLTPASGTVNGAAAITLPAGYRTTKFVSDGTNWFALNGQPATVGAANGYRNLHIDNNSGTENTQIAVTADYLALLDTSSNSLVVTSVSVVCNYSVNGANGLDTGTFAASTWYFHWIISNGTTTACLGSLSSTAPTMPSGYTFKMRVGANRADGSVHFNRVKQVNNSAQYVVSAATTTAMPIIGTTGAVGVVGTGPTVALAVANFVPTTAHSIKLVMNTANTAGCIAVSGPNNLYAGNNTTTNAPPLMLTSSAAQQSIEGVFVLESANIYWANTGCILYVQGWLDNI